MFRSITRMLMIILACAALVALAITAKVGATGANPIAWMASDSGPLAQGSKMGSVSATTTPNAALNAQDADSDGDSGAETSAAESAQENDQQSEQAQEQELSGTVGSVDSANSMFTLTISSGEVAVQVTSATQYEDGLSGLASLQSGMSVTVKSTAQAAGQTLATEVKGSSDTSSTDGTDTSSPDNGH